MMCKKVIYACLLSSAILVACGETPKTPKPDMKAMIEENFRHAAAQYKILASKIPADRMPQYYDPRKDSMVTSSTKWWCSGFYPGTLWYIL
jgi:unsaturated chondroitin disaccharide hydrolase